MTLSATLAPLALWALIGQALVYFSIPFKRRTRLSPILTGMTGIAITLAAGIVFGWARIGFGRPDLAGTAALGIAMAMVVLIGGRMIERVRGLQVPSDVRLTSLSPPRAAFEIFIRIPFLTALVEEAVFRGVLHAALVAVYPIETAIWIGAGLFGVWHVAPGIDQAMAGNKTPSAALWHTLATIVTTGAAGLVLVWLRVETGSIWAPAALHAAINTSLAYLVWRRADRSMTRYVLSAVRVQSN